MSNTRFRVTETFTTRLLGSAPADPQVYENFIASKKAEAEESRRKFAARSGTPLAEHPVGTIEEEIETINEVQGLTIFHSDLGKTREDGKPGLGLFLFDYQVMGYWKESAEILGPMHGVKQPRSKLDNFLVVRPRRVYLMRDGKPIEKADGRHERPLRAMTMQGPRVSLACSEYLDPGVTISYELDFLPLIKTGSGAEAKKLDLDGFVELLGSMSQRKGRCQWRNGGFGRFDVKIEPIQ